MARMHQDQHFESERRPANVHRAARGFGRVAVANLGDKASAALPENMAAEAEGLSLLF